MEKYFPTLFEDLKHEKPSFLLLSLNDPDILKQSKINDHEKNVNRIMPLEKLFRKRQWQKT